MVVKEIYVKKEDAEFFLAHAVGDKEHLLRNTVQVPLRLVLKRLGIEKEQLEQYPAYLGKSSQSDHVYLNKAVLHRVAGITPASDVGLASRLGSLGEGETVGRAPEM